MLIVYVDNIFITRNGSTIISKLVYDLNNSFFSLKDIGSLHFFLRIEAFRDQIGFFLTQSKYVTNLLQKINNDATKPLPILATFEKILFKSYGDPMDNPILHRSIVGTLQYVTVTRLDISYVFSKLSLLLQNPMEIY